MYHKRFGVLSGFGFAILGVLMVSISAIQFGNKMGRKDLGVIVGIIAFAALLYARDKFYDRRVKRIQAKMDAQIEDDYEEGVDFRLDLLTKDGYMQFTAVIDADPFGRFSMYRADDYRKEVPDFTLFHRDIDSVFSFTNTHIIRHGTATDNIMRGAALGGKTGAFFGALEPTGDDVIHTGAELIIRYHEQDQEEQTTRILMPENCDAGEAIAFAEAVAKALNNVRDGKPPVPPPPEKPKESVWP